MNQPNVSTGLEHDENSHSEVRQARHSSKNKHCHSVGLSSDAHILKSMAAQYKHL